jgi:hypothetical protein
LQLIEERHRASRLRLARDNASGYMGVNKVTTKRGQLVYRAQVTSGGEKGKILLERPASTPGAAEEVAKAYDRWAIKAHGRCAARPPARLRRLANCPRPLLPPSPLAPIPDPHSP